jgi:hypothetical protein
MNLRRASLSLFRACSAGLMWGIVEQVSQSVDGESDVEVLSDDSSGTPKKRRKARQREDNDLPEWTRKADVT